jgi:hypothetical protein
MRRIAFPVITIALLGILAIWWYRPSQVLQRRTRKILHTLTLPQGTDRPGRQMGIYSLNALLASQVEFEAPPSLDQASGFFDRSEVESAFSWLCEQAKQIHSVQIAGDQADVAFSIVALVELPTARLVDGPFEVVFHWQMENDTWRLARAKWVEAPRE